MKVHVVGSYGYGSLGDDCSVDLLRAELQGIWSGAEVVMGRLDSVPFSPEDQDASIVGGGGVIYRHVYPCGTDSLHHLLRYPAAMQCFGKKTFALGVGVQGRLDGENLQSIDPYLRILNRMHLRTVRDRESAHLLRKAGVTAPILECADLAYLMPVNPNQPERRRRKPVLGVLASQSDKGVIYDEFPGFEARIAEALSALKSTFDIHFFSFNPRADDWLPKSFEGGFEWTTYAPGENAIARCVADFNEVDIFLTTRLHGAILCAMKGIPFVAIGPPAEKLDRECRELDYPHFLSFEYTTDRFVSAVHEVRSNAPELRETLLAAAASRRDLAARSFDAMRGIEANETGDNDMESWQAAGKNGRTLVVWAARDNFWNEIRPEMNSLKSADCLLPFASAIQDSIFQERFALPRNGVMHWAAFPEALRARFMDRYENVLICHEGQQASRPENLMEIGAKAGRNAWECRLWTQAVRPLSFGKSKGAGTWN